jgi:hypothetical protein
MATLSDRDAFQKSTTNPVSADDSFSNLHPLVHVQGSKMKTTYGPELLMKESAPSFSISIF